MSFNLFIVLVLAGGWAAARLMAGARLPGILGMLLFGLGLGVAGGDVILSLAVLAILITAPLGLILIRHLGEKLP